MRKVAAIAFVLGAVMLMASPARATVLSFNYGTIYNGPGDLDAPPPWMTGTLSDEIGNGDLLLTLNTAGLFFDGASVSDVFFNFNPAKTLTGLNVALGPTDTTKVGGVSAYTGATIGVNCCQASGPGGDFDIDLNFGPGAAPPVFEGNDVISFVISHATLNLVLADFVEKNSAGFYSAAHVQSINTSNLQSAWIATTATPTLFEVPPTVTPEPASLLLLGSGLLGVVRTMRKRKTVV